MGASKQAMFYKANLLCKDAFGQNAARGDNSQQARSPSRQAVASKEALRNAMQQGCALQGGLAVKPSLTTEALRGGIARGPREEARQREPASGESCEAAQGGEASRRGPFEGGASQPPRQSKRATTSHLSEGFALVWCRPVDGKALGPKS